MEINAVSVAPERPCSPGGTADGTPASGAFLALLLQLLGIAGEGPVTPDPGGGNPVWNPGEAGTPGTPAGVFQTVPAEKLPLSPPGDAGIMEPLLPPAGSVEGPGELEEGGGREQFTGGQEVLLAALLNFCGMMENKMPATVPAGADAGGGEGNSPAVDSLSRLLEAVVNPPAPPPEAGRGDGQAGQHTDAAVVELKGPALPELLQDETQSYDAFLKERILQLLRCSGILEPGRGSRAVDSQQPEVRQPGVPENLGEVVVHLVYRQGDVSAHFLASNAAAGDAIESALPQLREALAAQNLHLQNASVSVGEEGGNPRPDYNTVHGKAVPAFDHGAANLEFKNARVPVDVVPQSTIPGGKPDSDIVEAPNTRGGVVSRQIAQDTTSSPLMNRNDSAGTPGHNPAQYQSTNHSGDGITGTSNNLSNPIIQRENVNLLQMPALIGRVLRQAVARHIEGQTHLWFKLEPEHLGEVMVRLVYRHGDVSAHFLASNAAAGDAIESALPQLREALAAQNLHLHSASVSVGHEGGLPPRSDYQQPGYNYGRQYSGPGVDPEGSTGQEQPADPLPGGINFFV
ncbi:flagellar hook-length control protein FliK [Desulfofundulus thermocisternus]|uniref:flagellar hook-length control protein FliK n=1 Tax=Desulfofundulus thermocisternus TaxID=42471 RepID=UPI00048004E4|nr:flagellar hook-length control protein FliK [Desulfofundulus thermocisternus]